MASESPIEALFISALASIEPDRITVVENATFDLLRQMVDDDDTQSRIYAAQQVRFGGYRVDVMLATFGGSHVRMVAIECDGHQFHRATAEQMGRDAARDEDLRAAGVKTLRLSGKRINRDSFKCAREAVEFLDPMNALPDRGFQSFADVLIRSLDASNRILET